MRIQQIRGNSYKAPNFGGLQRAVYEVTRFGAPAVLRHRNDTSFFRNQLFWVDLVKILQDRYKNCDKVNVFNYACSNGSETYTLIMAMLSHLSNDDAKKFFPVVAKDYDEYVIELAKKGELSISDEEISDIESITGCPVDKFFTLDSFMGRKYVSPKPILKDNAKFQEANILSDVLSLPPDNTVILARNFWPYLPPQTLSILVDRLSERLRENSTVVIGKFDVNFLSTRLSMHLDKMFLDKGFSSLGNDGLIFTR